MITIHQVYRLQIMSIETVVRGRQVYLYLTIDIRIICIHCTYVSFVVVFYYSALAEGTILDNHQLICLFMLSQLLERELNKCLRLVVAIPMDMTSFYGNTKYIIVFSFFVHQTDPQCSYQQGVVTSSHSKLVLIFYN